MEKFISGTLYGVLCAAIPYGIYCRLRNKNRYKLMKVFFVVLISLFVMPLIKMLSIEELKCYCSNHNNHYCDYYNTENIFG